MSAMTLRARHFRVLDNFDWSPDGLCLLAGANGTGKTTVLDLLLFLRNLFDKGAESAFVSIGGTHISSRGSNADDIVSLEIEIGEVRWVISLPTSAADRGGVYGEALFHAGQSILHIDMYSAEWLVDGKRIPRDPARCAARFYWDRNEPDWMRPFVTALQGMRIYQSFWLNKVQEPTANSAASFLHGKGVNLWSVLSNWKSAPLRYRGQYDWVLAEARKAFPGIIGSIEFDRGSPYLFAPDATDPADGLPPERASAGLLVGLLQLAAVAGAPSGSIVAFDELENHLHPHAIRSILRALRSQAQERGLTVIITTHSPIVMNSFRDDPEQFYVFEPDHSPTPVRLTAIHEEAWLSAFMLGDLYDRLELGAPRFDVAAG